MVSNCFWSCIFAKVLGLLLIDCTLFLDANYFRPARGMLSYLKSL